MGREAQNAESKMDFVHKLTIAQKECDEWLALQAEKEEDENIMQHYTHDDESKVKALNLEIERLALAVMKEKSALDDAELIAAALWRERTIELARGVGRVAGIPKCIAAQLICAGSGNCIDDTASTYSVLS